MRKDLARTLSTKAAECARIFSDPNREWNHSKESFEVHEIIPLSESIAAVIFLKSSDKKAVAFFYYVKNSWRYFFPSDSHILGMRYFEEIKLKIEAGNYEENFEGS